MIRTARLLLLPLLLAGCLGTDVDNPDQTEERLLVAEPAALELGALCAGGTARTSVRIRNVSGQPIDAAAGGAAAEAYPSVFALGSDESLPLAVVIHLPGDARGEVEGDLLVHHVVADGDGDTAALAIPWSAAVDPAPLPRAAVLCGAESICEGIAFGRLFVGPSWQQPLEVANDGCAPLRIEAIEVEGPAARIVGPDLPATVAPGERWSGVLVLDAEAPGVHAGDVVVRVEGAAPQRIGWIADVAG